MRDIELLPRMPGSQDAGICRTECALRGGFSRSVSRSGEGGAGARGGATAGAFVIHPEETAALSGLGQVARGLVRAIAGRSKQPETRATVDQDATIIESHKREALWTYEGTRGISPWWRCGRRRN